MEGAAKANRLTPQDGGTLQGERLADIRRAVVGCMGGSACCARGAGHRDTVARYYRGCGHVESLLTRDKVTP
jgi:hypothetical protein